MFSDPKLNFVTCFKEELKQFYFLSVGSTIFVPIYFQNPMRRWKRIPSCWSPFVYVNHVHYIWRHEGVATSADPETIYPPIDSDLAFSQY